MKLKKIFSKTTEKINLEVFLTEDRLKLYLTCDPGSVLKKSQAAEDSPPLEEEGISRREILGTIKEGFCVDRVEKGVVDDVVSCINRGDSVKERKIAGGVAPSTGIDGKLIYLVKVYDGTSSLEQQDDKELDLRRLHLFDNVTTGQEIARIYPPRQGKDGVDVFGEALPGLLGREFTLQKVSSIKTEEVSASNGKYLSLIAENDGLVAVKQGIPSIQEELCIKGSLDFHIGNIDFIGKVRIKGDVLPGFQVKATKGIEVDGAVRDATLICTGGDIIIKGAAFGSSENAIVSAGYLEVGSSHELRANAKKDLVIKKEMRDSVLKSQAEVLSPKGRLLGGHIFTVCGVEAAELGNPKGSQLVIQFCTEAEATVEYYELSQQIKKHTKALGLLKLHLGPFTKDRIRILLLKPEQQDKINALYKKHEAVNSSLTVLESKMQALLDGKELGSTLRVNYLSKFYPGTVILAADQRFFSEEELNGPGSVEFIRQEEKFIDGEYQKLDSNNESEMESEDGTK